MNAPRLGLAFVLLLVMGTLAAADKSDKKPDPKKQTPEDVIKELVKVQNQVADVLETVKDDASADAALPKLQKVAAIGAELGKTMEDFKLSKEEQEKLFQKHGEDFVKAYKRSQAAMDKAEKAKVSMEKLKKLAAALEPPKKKD